MKKPALLLSLILLAPGVCLAQTTAFKTTPMAGAPVITAAASAERLRFTAPSSVVQMHLQVYAETGQTVFDVTSKGNVLDWTMQDGNGEHLIPGSYLCVVTVKSLSGRLSQRIGSVLVQGKQVELQRLDSTALTAAQQQAVGPIEENASLTVLKANEAEAVTALSNHNGEGQIIRDRGALSFRLGDFFSGDDKEQMRLTEEGNLGIGTGKPQAKLDVAGDIRSTGFLKLEKGVEFADGTVQTSGQSGRRDKDGNLIPNAAGSGTQNRIAKWTETGGAGTLGDAAAFETGGMTFFGQNQAGQIAPLFPGSDTYHVLEIGAPGTKSPLTMAGGSSVMEMWRDLGGGTGAPAAAVSYGMAKPGTPATDDLVLSTYKVGIGWNERMRVMNTGNVGIGTGAPAAKLDVTGNINTSTQYNIGGERVLVASGTFQNTLVGVGAAQNSTGSLNAFFGYNAGTSNTGSDNSFFGRSTGQLNTGNYNAFFGDQAGRSNTGDSNSFIGSFAGGSNSSGEGNSFLGRNAGSANDTGSRNAFFGFVSGGGNTTGSDNSFFGYYAGPPYVQNTGIGNTLLGSSTSMGTTNPQNFTNATAIGFRAEVRQSNSLVLGSINTINGATADTKVGIGTTAPEQALHINGDSEVLSTGGGAGFKFRNRGSGSFNDDWVWYSSSNVARFFRAGVGDLLFVGTNGNLGVGASSPTAKLQVSGGDASIATQGKGLILRATDGGTCYRVTVNNVGALSTTPVACP